MGKWKIYGWCLLLIIKCSQTSSFRSYSVLGTTTANSRAQPLTLPAGKKNSYKQYLVEEQGNGLGADWSIATPTASQLPALAPTTQQRILQYIQHRENQLLAAAAEKTTTQSEVNTEEEEKDEWKAMEEKAEKAKELLSMFQPSGWYNDKIEEDFKARIDVHVPKKLHPLSYLELRKYGYEDLIEEVMALGGPLVVGQALSIPWTEPEPQPREEGESGSHEPINLLEYQGGLSLGASLDERLAEAEHLSLEKIKQQQRLLTGKERSLSSSTELPNKGRLIGDDHSYSNRKTTQKQFVNLPSAEQPRNPLNRFQFTQNERIYLTSFLLTFSLAWGRASEEMVSYNAINSPWLETLHFVLQLTCGGLCAVSLISAALVAKEASKASLNILVWAPRALLGGPLTIRHLREAIQTS